MKGYSDKARLPQAMNVDSASCARSKRRSFLSANKRIVQPLYVSSAVPLCTAPCLLTHTIHKTTFFFLWLNLTGHFP